MPVYDMKCPRCGKESTEYDENKWKCLHCGNKFVYKEESPTYHSQTNVSIQGSSLFDVEPYDPGNERAYKKSYQQAHSLRDDSGLKELKSGKKLALGLGLIFLMLLLSTVASEGAAVGAVIFFICLLLCIFRFSSNHKELIKRTVQLKKKVTVGWITLCPSCKEEHSRYRNDEKDPTSGPAHCRSCGKQFMLLEGKAHGIKMEGGAA